MHGGDNGGGGHPGQYSPSGSAGLAQAHPRIAAAAAAAVTAFRRAQDTRMPLLRERQTCYLRKYTAVPLRLNILINKK